MTGHLHKLDMSFVKNPTFQLVHVTFMWPWNLLTSRTQLYAIEVYDAELAQNTTVTEKNSELLSAQCGSDPFHNSWSLCSESRRRSSNPEEPSLESRCDCLFANALGQSSASKGDNHSVFKPMLLFNVCLCTSASFERQRQQQQKVGAGEGRNLIIRETALECKNEMSIRIVGLCFFLNFSASFDI